MIHLKGQLICKNEEEHAAVMAHLDEHIRLTRAEPGCLSFEVSPAKDPMAFDVRETFRDRAAFDAHQSRTRASAWFAATRDIVRDFAIEDTQEGAAG